MPDLEVIVWPYHGGLADVSMGLGASVLATDERFREGLAAAGWQTRVVRVPPVDETLPEVARVFELVRRLAQRVAAALERDAFALVLGGNCVSCLGTTAGVGGGGDLGVVWLDAHADFDTPEDNLSGFTDVMGLAILTGSCWRALRDTIPGFVAVEESRVVLAGTRDLEPYQRDRLGASQVQVVPGAVAADARDVALDVLREQVERIYLHVDLDVLDSSVGRANPYAAPGGPDLDAVLAAIEATFVRFDVAAAAITAYDPRVDDDGTIGVAAGTIASHIASHAARQRGAQR
jgi:arginase